MVHRYRNVPDAANTWLKVPLVLFPDPVIASSKVMLCSIPPLFQVHTTRPVSLGATFRGENEAVPTVTESFPTVPPEGPVP
jgi:hypothetical protein